MILLGDTLNKLGTFVYWLACAYVLSVLLFMSDWQMFYDGFSIVCTFVPAFFALFIFREQERKTRIRCSLKVMWTSATLTMLYGVILTLSNFTPDYIVIAASVSISLLPLFYALCASLLVTPLIFRIKTD
ncbi:membrane hypothetical protein [Vibrio nigripulchritudo SFn118]|nr:membrane hypothetical protein [Vibrio nigripulchritudo SFn118]